MMEVGCLLSPPWFVEDIGIWTEVEDPPPPPPPAWEPGGTVGPLCESEIDRVDVMLLTLLPLSLRKLGTVAIEGIET